MVTKISRHSLSRLSQLFSLTFCIMLVLFTQSVNAITQRDIDSILGNTTYYKSDDTTGCSTQSNLPNAAEATIDGHTLPAVKGGIGIEEEAVLRDGRAVIADGSPNAGGRLALAPTGMSELDVKYYITMRWRYALWAWDGTSTNDGALEDGTWYTQGVRKVLVTNPATGRSIVTSILESGPAPWTGTPEGKDTPHPYWQGYIDGTPPEYNGRVGGLSPDAFGAIDNGEIQWTGGAGQELLFTWADQSLSAGSILEGGKVVSVDTGSSGCTNGSAVPTGQFVFYSQRDPRWASHPYGSSTINDSGCGPTSVAMVVATLKDRTVTPVETADFGTQHNTIQPDGGSTSDMMTLGPANWGLKSRSIGVDLNQAASVLRSGGLVIASGHGAVPYTLEGHIIVLRGITADGKFLVGDPYHPEANSREFEEFEIAEGLANLWAVTL